MRRLVNDLAAAVIVGPELALWRARGLTPRLWWRDDDACAPSVALNTLIGMANDRPLALAVIPSGDSLKALADWLSASNLSVGQHGIDHVNRSAGEVNSEYPADVSVAQMARAIGEGRSRLLAAGMTPIFYTPPWNAVQPVLAEALRDLDFRILCAGAVLAGSNAGLVYIATDVDLIRWKGQPRFRGAWKVLLALRKALKARRRSGAMERPIGLLTHHLDHDAATWRFLSWLLPYADRRLAWTDVANFGAG